MFNRCLFSDKKVKFTKANYDLWNVEAIFRY